MSYCTHLKEHKTSKCFGVLQVSVPGPVVLFIMLFRLSIVLSRGLHPKTVLDSGFWILEFLLELGFWIPIISGIPDSWSWVPHFKALDSKFQKQKFPEFQIPKAKIFWIPDFTSENLPDSGFHKQKFTGFRNSLSKISMIMESGLPYIGRIVRFSSRWGSATEMFALVGKTESLY